MDDKDKSSPFDFRRAKYKQVIDADAAKKKRETVINQVRKQKKEDRWQKFRSGGAEPGSPFLGEATASPLAPSVGPPELVPTKNLDPAVAMKVRALAW
jgi:hypothetical protein